MLSRAPHFDVGGSLHVVVNNQVANDLIHSLKIVPEDLATIAEKIGESEAKKLSS